MRIMILVVLLFAVFQPSAYAINDGSRLSVLVAEEAVRLTLNDNGPVLVQEQRNYPLTKGTSRLVYAYGSAKLRPETLTLRVDKKDQGVQLGTSAESSREAAKLWHVASEQAKTLPCTLTYVLEGIDHQVHYRLHVNGAKKVASFEGRVVLRNFSGASFDKADLWYRGEPIYEGPLPEGGTRTIAWRTWPRLPLKKVYVWDARQQPWEPQRGQTASIPIEFRFDNSKENELGLVLPSGKVRVFQTDEARAAAFLGEHRLLSASPGKPIKLPVLQGRDLRVIQKRMTSKQVNLRPNTRRPRLVDIEESLETTIVNQQAEPAEIELVQSLNGQWEERATSHSYRREDAGTILFPLTVAPGATVTVQFDYVRRNVRR